MKNPYCYHGLEFCQCVTEIECPIHGKNCLHCGEACKLEHDLWEQEIEQLKKRIYQYHAALNVIAQFPIENIFIAPSEKIYYDITAELRNVARRAIEGYAEKL